MFSISSLQLRRYKWLAVLFAQWCGNDFELVQSGFGACKICHHQLRWQALCRMTTIVVKNNFNTILKVDDSSFVYTTDVVYFGIAALKAG